MIFKNWAYWLKGGFIGLLLILIVELSKTFINLVPAEPFIINAIGSVIYLIIQFTIGFPANIIYWVFGPQLAIHSGYSCDIISRGCDKEILSIIRIISILSYIIVGIFIGWVIGRRRSKMVK